MGTHAVQRQATARTVSENVKRLRLEQNLGLRALSTELGEVGRPLTHSAVDQIEKGTRRVDVDDLMALAAALNVSPATLLMPAGDKDYKVAVTGHPRKLPCHKAWEWITAQWPTTIEGLSVAIWLGRSRPSWALDVRAPVVKVSDGDN